MIVRVFSLKSLTLRCIHCTLHDTVNFNLQSKEGHTPLLVAANNNCKNSVLWMLQDGARLVDVRAVDNEKRNAVHLASSHLNCQYTIEVEDHRNHHFLFHIK